MKKTIAQAILFTSFFFISISFCVAQAYELSLDNRPIFSAKKTTNKITVDGLADEKDWQKTEARTLNYFYLTQQPYDKQKTTFRMLWDDETLYLLFECEDKYLTSSEKERDGEPYLDDCAEFFVIPAPKSTIAHFCFEINLYETKNDVLYINNFYENQDTAIKAYNPNYQVKVTYEGTMNNNDDVDNGWIMELAIPIKALSRTSELYPIKTGTRWAFTALRQERNELEIGRRVISTIFPIEDISKKVHQPNTFGIVEFID
ncbi:carbohydrate-binding family 9-like protein [Tamlana fucoidanivorans]|uniref:Carbohydrate-binding domain-containing protein n=1 Tax=Allotamlana fucoidanivorans TaxID=2583814 RepID=A0A5C4SPD5_9FLAO|nr:carbohydrate-binding family 9-like protein [Tamlana fucoidanivorans]TNJ45740.1 hypothetical protein FGF67_04985 [Tamlana fucoidanivorans]